MKQALIWVLFVGFTCIIWEYLTTRSQDLCFLLPAPSQIAKAFIGRFDRILIHSVATAKEMMGALMLSLLSALPLVWAMIRFQHVGKAIQTLFVLFQSIPTFCLAPLMVMWFGWSFTAVILPSSLMMLFPLTLSIYKGVEAPSEHSFEYFRLHKATPWQLFIKLQLPSALPYFFSGLRIALAISGIGAIVGEWSGANYGLGVLMIETRQSMDYEMTFAALFALVVLTMSFYLIGIFFEKRCWSMYRAVFSSKVVCLCLLFFSVSACSKKEEILDKERPVQLMLDWLPNPNHVPLYVGKSLQFFKEEGINLTLTKAASLDPLQPLTTKQVDLVISYFPRTILACSKDAQVKIVGKLIQEPLDCLIVLEDSDITSPENLSNKLIGLSDSHFTTYFLDALFTSVVPPPPPRKQNVNFDLAGALVAKQVDAIYGAFWNIEPEQIAAQGYKTRCFPVTDFNIPDYDELVIVASKNSYYSSKEFVERFQRALQKSIDFSIAHPEDAFQLYLAENVDKSVKVQAWELKAWKKTLPALARSQSFSLLKVTTFINWFAKKGIITKEPRADECIMLD